jgi:hypothetical protein
VVARCLRKTSQHPSVPAGVERVVGSRPRSVTLRTLEVAVAATFPLAEGRAAYESGATRRQRPGKTVLVVRD